MPTMPYLRISFEQALQLCELARRHTAPQPVFQCPNLDCHERVYPVAASNAGRAAFGHHENPNPNCPYSDPE